MHYKSIFRLQFWGNSLDVLPPSGSSYASLTRTASFSHWAGGSADGSQGLRRRRGSWLDGSCPGGGFRLQARRWPGPGAAGGCRPATMGKASEQGGFFSKPRSRASFVNLSMFPNSGCGEIHTGSGLLQSLTGNQDLCPILVCLILRLPGSNHSSLLRIHGLHLDSVKYPRQPESKTNPMKRLASTGCPTCAVCGCVPPVPAQRREPLHARAWPPAPGEGSRR